MMKKFLILALAFVLSGCGAIFPVSPTPAPTGTAHVVVQTVMVTVLVTQLITETPSNTATATLTPVPTFTATSTIGATSAASSMTPGTPGTVSATPPASPGATLPADAGGGLFTNMTRSSDRFALSCQPNTITFALTSTNPSVTEVDLFYRMENQSGSSVSGWIDIGKMTPGENGSFTMDFPASNVDPDLRGNPWLDYQFVGLDKAGHVIGRSARIVRQVAFGCSA
jgi:hypothetical protein